MSSSRGLTAIAQGTRALRSSYLASGSRFASTSSSRKGKAKAVFPTSDATSSASAEDDWVPALPQGQSAAYDISLQYLRSHRDTLLTQVSQLQSSSPSSSTREEIDRLTVEALVNDPATRRLFRDTNGEGQMDNVVMRHLAERRWKKDGGLDLLMQRVHQLVVVPDLLPGVNGQVAPLRILDAGGKEVEPGYMELPSRWASPPDLRVQLFHHPSPPTAETPFPTNLYTLLMIDPDSPTVESQSFAQRIHYAKTDIPLGVLSGSQNLFDTGVGKEVLRYEPPAPPRGTGKHRYSFFLLRQPSAGAVTIPTERDNFDLRTFLSEAQMTAEDVVAVNLFRAQWTAEEDAYIQQAYRESRGVDAPVFGKPPKEMRYGYPMSSKAQRAEEIRQAAWNEAVADLEDIGNEVEELEQRRMAA